MSKNITTLSKASFYTFPTSRSTFTGQLKASQLLSSLWYKSNSFDATNDKLNAPSTLPIDLKPKGVVFNEVAKENPGKAGPILKIKQTLAYGKSLIAFYKKGVANVWNNKKEMNKLMKTQFKLINQLNNKGEEVDIRIPNFKKLTSEMSQALYMSNIENKNALEITRGDIIKTDKLDKLLDENLFNLTRREFQLLRRTPSDFLKLPGFAIIFMIFVETTPILCYAMPEVTPLTCVLPSLIPRIWSPKYTKLLRDLRNKEHKEDTLESLATKNAHNLPIRDVRLLCNALRLTSKYIPASAWPESIIRRRLQEYYQYLKVDNYFLSGLNGKEYGNIWNLSNQEILNAALERNLILDIKKDTAEFDDIKNESLKQVKEEEYFNDLRLKLFHFIVDFETYNVGYLGVNHLIKDPIQSKTIINWWKEDHQK